MPDSLSLVFPSPFRISLELSHTPFLVHGHSQLKSRNSAFESFTCGTTIVHTLSLSREISLLILIARKRHCGGKQLYYLFYFFFFFFFFFDLFFFLFFSYMQTQVQVKRKTSDPTRRESPWIKKT